MRVCFSGGGTLGHVIPAMSVINYPIFKKDNDIAFVGSSNGVEIEFLKRNISSENLLLINMNGFDRRYFGINVKNILTMKKLITSMVEVKEFYKRFKPDLVVGMGGFISFVAIYVAKKMKIKTLIHEQNACFGLANKLLLSKVNKVLVTYSNLANGENIVYVGNPRMSEVFTKYKNLKYIEKPHTLLAVGGSRGSDKINEMILSLESFFVENNITCTLITGKKYYAKHKNKLQQNYGHIKILPFTNDLIYYLLTNEVVISRSGATTISEIIALNKPCIFIPSPNVTNDHQRKNVIELEKMKCALMLEEKKLLEHTFKDKILEVFNNKNIYQENLKKINFINSIELFIKQIIEVYNE